MKINIKNKDKIEAILDEVNGKSERHTFTTAVRIQMLLEAVENRLRNSNLVKKDMIGTFVIATSGKPVSSSYKYERRATRVEFERTSTGWFMTRVRPIEIRPNEGGAVHIHLTWEQLNKIQDRSIEGYFVK